MRNLRWAAELGVSGDDAKARLGVSQLNALGDSDMLDEAQQLFVDAALAAVVEDPVDELEEDHGTDQSRRAATATQAKQVVMTGAQHAAAKAIVKRDAAKGRTTTAAITKIATAKVRSDGHSSGSAQK